MAETPLTASDVDRLRRSVGVTRMLSWMVVIVCVLMAGVMAQGAVVAWRLAQWGTFALGLGGFAVMVGLAALTLGLVRRQRQILEAGETLLQLQGPGRSPDPDLADD